MKKPHHESRKTRPYTLRGFSAGIEVALWLTGLMCGAFHSVAMEGGIVEVVDGVPNVQRAQEPAPPSSLNESILKESIGEIEERI